MRLLLLYQLLFKIDFLRHDIRVGVGQLDAFQIFVCLQASEVIAYANFEIRFRIGEIDADAREIGFEGGAFRLGTIAGIVARIGRNLNAVAINFVHFLPRFDVVGLNLLHRRVNGVVHLCKRHGAE